MIILAKPYTDSSYSLIAQDLARSFLRSNLFTEKFVGNVLLFNVYF